MDIIKEKPIFEQKTDTNNFLKEKEFWDQAESVNKHKKKFLSKIFIVMQTDKNTEELDINKIQKIIV